MLKEIKGRIVNCDIYKYIETRKLFKVSLKYPQFNLNFNWIIRLRSGFKYNTAIAIRNGRVFHKCLNVDEI